MKIAQKRSKKIPIVIATLLLIGSLAGGIAWYSHTRKQADGNSSKSSENSKNASSDERKQQESATDTKEQTVNEDVNKPDSSENSAQDDSLNVSLTASGKDASVYRLRYLIEQTLANGTCTLTLTKGSQTLSRSAPTQSLPSSSTCQGFDIDMNELSAGTWQAELTVESDNRRGKSTNTITI